MFGLLHQAARLALAGMAWIPGGTYRPLHAHGGRARVEVVAFALDRHAVTREQFLAFVRENPEWRRSTIGTARAESSYLRDWQADLNPGSGRRRDEPVVNVSWYAATAYCKAEGGRLPTTDEWEYAAAASETQRDATSDPAFIRRLVVLDQTGGTSSGFRNVYGVSGLHGGAWEWTSDFHGAPMDAQHHSMDHAPSHHDASCAGAAIGVADPSNYPAFLRDAVRASLTPRATTSHVGFRCAV
jgi:formylglycine-generating enzyme required for sulfatase activity